MKPDAEDRICFQRDRGIYETNPNAEKGFSCKRPDTCRFISEFGQPDRYNYDPVIPSYIQFVDGRRFTFQYNVYGEMARANLPTGGAIEYDYGDGHNGSADDFEG
jgi:hypothetical protein